MNTPTDLQLQLALTKELPELIEFKQVLELCNKSMPGSFLNKEGFYVCLTNDYVFKWINTNNTEQWDDWFDVTPREWDWVVRECVSKLNIARLVEYGIEVASTIPDCVYDGQAHWGRLASATWQQRAIAYFKTIGKEIV